MIRECSFAAHEGKGFSAWQHQRVLSVQRRPESGQPDPINRRKPGGMIGKGRKIAEVTSGSG